MQKTPMILTRNGRGMESPGFSPQPLQAQGRSDAFWLEHLRLCEAATAWPWQLGHRGKADAQSVSGGIAESDAPHALCCMGSMPFCSPAHVLGANGGCLMRRAVVQVNKQFLHFTKRVQQEIWEREFGCACLPLYAMRYLVLAFSVEKVVRPVLGPLQELIRLHNGHAQAQASPAKRR